MASNELNFLLRMRDEASAAIKQVSSALSGASTTASSFSTTASSTASAMTNLASGARTVAAAVTEMYAATKLLRAVEGDFMDYEKGLARIQSVSGMTSAQIEQFSQQFDKLNLSMQRIPRAELNEMIADLSQMGIANKDLTGMAETIGKMSAATDLGAGDVAQKTATILQLTGQGMDKAKEFGDQLAYVDKNANATSRQIFNMAMNVAQGTSQFNMSSKALLALSATAANLHIWPELMRSVPQRALMQLQQGAMNASVGFQNFLKVTNMTKDGFNELLQQHPEEVFLRFAEAYKKTVSTGESKKFLDSLHLDTVQVNTVLGNLANNANQVRKYISDLDAGKATGALDERYKTATDTQYDTMLKSKKELEDLGKNLGTALAPLTHDLFGAVAIAVKEIDDHFKGMPKDLQAAAAAAVLLGPPILAAGVAIRTVKTLFSTLNLAQTLLQQQGSMVASATEIGTAAGEAMAKAMSAAQKAGMVTGQYATEAEVLAASASGPLVGSKANVRNARSAAKGAITREMLDATAAAEAGAAEGEASGVAAGNAFRREFLAKTRQTFNEAKAVAAEGGAAIGVAAGEASAIGGSIGAASFAGAFMSKLPGLLGGALSTFFKFELAKLGGELVGGLVNRVAPQMAQRIADWRDHNSIVQGIVNNPVTRFLGIDPKSLHPEVEQARQAQAAAAADAQGDGGPMSVPTLRGQTPPKPPGGTYNLDDGHKHRQGKEAQDVIGPLRDQLALAEATTGQARLQVEYHQKIAEIAKQLKVTYDAAERMAGGLVHAIQEAKRAEAVRDFANDNGNQIESAKAVTAELQLQASIHQKIKEIEKEHGTLSEQQRQTIAQQLTLLQQVKQQAAYDELVRQTNLNLSALRATTQESKDYLEVVKQIADFERANGQLADGKRQALAEQLLLQKQIAAAQQLQDQLDPVSAARRKYADSSSTIASMQGITPEYRKQLQDMLDQQTLKARDPLADFVKTQSAALPSAIDKNNKGAPDKEAVTASAEAQKTLNQLLQDGVQITPQLTSAVNDYEAALAKLKKDQTTGLEGWANSIAPLRDQLDTLQKDFAQNLSGALQGALMGRRGSYRQAIQAMSGQIVQVGVNSFLKNGLGLLGIQKPEQKDAADARSALGKVQQLSTQIQAAQAVINVTSATLNGQQLGAATKAANDNGNILAPANDNGTAANIDTAALGASAPAKTAVGTANQALAQAGQSLSKIGQAGQQANFGASAVSTGLGLMNSSLNQAVPGLGSFAQGIEGLLGKLLSGGGGGGGGLGGIGSLLGAFADGGRISGPGTGRSDSILARVSHGEFIVNAAATARHEPLLHAINSGSLPGYADGGMVNSLGMAENSLGGGLQAGMLSAIADRIGNSGGQGGGNVSNTRNNTVNVNIHTKDADSFRRSRGQVAGAAQINLSRVGGRHN